MTRTLPITGAILMLALASACGSKLQKAGGSVQPQLSYTPAGCNYTVWTPWGVANPKQLGSAGTPLTMAPLHVHASFAGDPSSTFAVNWKAEPGATLVQILYGTDKSAVSSATAAGSGVNLQNGHSFDIISAQDGTSLAVHIQEAHVCGLTPATTYYYKVGNTGAFSDVYSVTTAPPVGSTTEFKFATAGDARDDPNTFAQAEADMAARGPAFEVFSGDAVDVGAEQYEWDQLFEASASNVTVQSVLASLPFMTTNGNHENLALNFLGQFALPQQAGGGEDDTGGQGHPTEKAWYSFNYGNVHFIVLNDTTVNLITLLGAEKNWLASDLGQVNRSQTPWIIVTHHQPIYSCDNVHGSDQGLGDAWQPLFDQYQVDLVLNGHVHNYQRSNPVRGSNVNAPAGQGTIYVVAGAVGAPLYGYNTGSCAFSETGATTSNYAIVDVKGNTLTFTAYDLMGGDVQLDQFTLTKG
jgi:hypothetical protein